MTIQEEEEQDDSDEESGQEEEEGYLSLALGKEEGRKRKLVLWR